MDASLICQLCSRPYTDPRMLSCLHCFCRDCLHSLTIQHEYEGTPLHCRTCKKHANIPPGGVNDLPKDLHLGVEVKIEEFQSKVARNNKVFCDFCAESTSAVGFCCSCLQFLCQLCSDYHRRVRNLSQHDVALMGESVSRERLSAVKPSCVSHNKEFVLYCETCSCLICHECTTTVHKDHVQNVKLPSAVAKPHKDDAHKLLTETRDIVSTLTDAVNGNIRIIREVEENEEVASQSIMQTFLKLHQALEDRKSQLLEELHTFALSKKTALTLQKEAFEKVKQDLSHCSDIATSKLENYTDCEIISLKQTLSSELQSCITSAQSVSPEPCKCSDVSVALRPDLFELYLPQVCHLADTCPEKSIWSSLCTSATKGNEYTLTVEAKDSNGNAYPYNDIKLEVVLKPSTPAPSTPAPSTPAPSTPAPSTPAPSTPAPSTPAPSTPAPFAPLSTARPPSVKQPLSQLGPAYSSSFSQQPLSQLGPARLYLAQQPLSPLSTASQKHIRAAPAVTMSSAFAQLSSTQPPQTAQQALLLDDSVIGKVIKHKGGTYTITLTPVHEGPHLLSVTMNGHHVQQSPHKLHVNPGGMFCAFGSRT